MKKKAPLSEAEPELVILKEATENTNEGFVTIDQNHQVIIFNKAPKKFWLFAGGGTGKGFGIDSLPEACDNGP